MPFVEPDTFGVPTKPSLINPRHASANYVSKHGYDLENRVWTGAIFDIQSEPKMLITIGVEETEAAIIEWCNATLVNYSIDLPEAPDRNDRNRSIN